MKYPRITAGFSTVELLITLFVGTLLLAGGYQLYGIITKSSQATRMQTAASDAAYEILRTKLGQASTTCTAGTENGTALIPADYKLPPGSSYAITTECPNGGTATKMSVTLSYTVDGVERSVSRALFQ